MLKLDEQKDARFDVRVSMEQLMVIEARALLCGVNRSEYVRSMLDKSWETNHAKSHRPYVAIASLLLEISAKMAKVCAKQSLTEIDKIRLEEACKKLTLVLDNIIDRMALDQEAKLRADSEEETFE
jgi:hypothetical protein